MTANPPTTDSQQIAQGLVRVAMALRHEGYRSRERSGLSVTQSQITALLHSRGPMRVGDIARELGVTSPTASDSISSLQRKGLIERVVVSGNARATRVALTVAGTALAHVDGGTPLADVVGRLPQDHREGLLAGLVDLIGELTRDGTIAPARMCVGCAWFRPDDAPGTAAPHRCAFIDAPLRPRDLRIDCGDFLPREVAQSP
jgi:DNA-binding MarR family transcriptional regulator